MTHSQYLLPGLPDLLKSHRLSYKKFLHNGIDEEFDLLSAKTDLNEEEIFYEGLKLNHIDELSPSQVESLDYIYHAEEKIFLVPKRTLEDSLRGRQSHSFHLFIPLEVKILPFQDELDRSYFVGGKLSLSENKNVHHDITGQQQPLKWAPVMKTEGSPEVRNSRLELGSTFNFAEANIVGSYEEKIFSESDLRTSGPGSVPGVMVTDHSTPHIFFRGESGSLFSETRKEFFRVALSFFFQQPKIQKIFITKRFLLLRWFCEKLQHIEPSVEALEMGSPKFIQSTSSPDPNEVGIASFSGRTFGSLSLPISRDEFDLTFAQFDSQTKRKLYKLYQNVLLKFENQTQKKLFKSSSDQGSRSGSRSWLRSPTKEPIERANEAQSLPMKRAKPDLKSRIKVFQKTSHWAELITQIRVSIGEHAAQDVDRFFSTKRIRRKLPTKLANLSLKFSKSSEEKFSYPKFPNLSGPTLLARPTLLSAFNKKFPTDLHEKAQLPGFHTGGLTAGREPTSVRPGPGSGPLRGRGQKGSVALRKPGAQSAPGVLVQDQGSRFCPSAKGIRFGTIENTTGKKGQRLSHRSLRSNRLFQKVTFIQRIVQAKQIKNQKKKLQEIFLTTFPTIQEKKGLRVWKLQNSIQHRRRHAQSALLLPMKCATAAHEKPKVKFLKHFKNAFYWEIPFHFKPIQELRTILKPVSFADQFPSLLNSMTRSLGLFSESTIQSVMQPMKWAITPSKFLSLPQNETGSLWKILSKKSFGPMKFGRLGFQCYQLQKLAYRQRNMFILHSENFTKPHRTRKLSRINPASRDNKKVSKVANKRGQKKEMQPTKLAQKDRRSPLSQPENLTAGANEMGVKSKETKTGSDRKGTERSQFHGRLLKSKSGPGRPGVQVQVLSDGTKQDLVMKTEGPPEVGSPKILQKKFNFDRFFLKFKERQALHLAKSFELREKVALRIEKKSVKLKLLPEVKFWEKYHSEKRVEEYWESLLQAYRKKIPSKLLVSIPSGQIIFVKSEKDSRAKVLNADNEMISDQNRTWTWTPSGSNAQSAFQGSDALRAR